MIVAGLGTQAVAANSLAVTAEALCYQPGYGVSTAATTLVGQSLGAGRRDMAVRFARVSTLLGMAIMTGMGLLMFLFAQPLIGMFTPDRGVMELGASVLRIEAFAEPFFRRLHCGDRRVLRRGRHEMVFPGQPAQHVGRAPADRAAAHRLARPHRHVDRHVQRADSQGPLLPVAASLEPLA